MTTDLDQQYMRRCLELAARAAGRTSPNPMVGCVVLDADGSVTGEGYHRRAGEPHAEIVALDEGGDKARGGTLYVNLEPCCHVGRTPPCVERLISSGLRRVVAGMVDPNPAVAGGGIKALREAGIEVEIGILEEECRWLNRAFIKHVGEKLPWVCLKLASTLDGKIADRNGASRWITGPEARRRVHELRNTFDCVLIGGATAVRDDPELNVREIPDGRNPLRAVVDSSLNVSPQSRLCLPDTGGDTVIFCSELAISQRGRLFPEHATLVPVPYDQEDKAHLDLRAVLSWLGQHDILSVLCEGGGRLAGALLQAGLVDELEWFVSPRIIGDTKAVPAVACRSTVPLDQAWCVKVRALYSIGDDIQIHAMVIR